MQTTTLKLHSLEFGDIKTYLASVAFVIGNIVLPQLLHLVPQGGTTWLPIYFFTLVGSYKYGWKVGLLTAVASPLANALWFGMPAITSLPAILLKSVLLAVAAGYVAHKWQKVTLPLILVVVLFYQIIGTIGEWVMKGDFYDAVQDFRIGIPGMALQVLGGYLFVKHLIRR